MRKLLLILFLYCGTAGYAQISIFQDADGESGFLFNQGGSEIIVSSGETSITYGFNKFVAKGGEPSENHGYGFNIEVAGANGVATVVEDGIFNPKGSLGGFYLKPLGKKSPSLMFMPYMNVSASTATVLNPENLDAGTETKDIFNYEVGISLSRNSSLPNNQPVIWGLTVNFGERANLSGIGPLTFKQNNTISGTSFFSEKEITGYDVSEFDQIDNLSTFNINFDYAIFLSNDPNTSNFLMALHLRHRQLGDNSVGKFGLGFYGSKGGAPQDIIGGVNIMYNDLYDTLDDFLNNYRNISINLVVGFKI